ncbi:DUF3794 domain-containing protein [Desulfitobacterium metallireducens]|uniref:SipL SPOCS domain-containing protein n=1 Tax=Desulfitobacterium metallireducens DSM 15288 TaxID=871968 RepID=W0EGW6_9FIRM|nr:DUF3794 domain-containing protein [Desulfitobacterium metallireducens]AHF08449.1 hypothetical protein DESME_03035 [Desulfitobacterium metallireducens DSM 15288]
MNFPFTLSECSPLSSEEVECSNEILVCAEVSIPEPKPDVNQIVQLKHEVKIENITPIPVRTTHDPIKGQKLLIRGLLFLSIEYSSELPEQTIHIVHSNIPFDTLITQEQECNPHQLSLQVIVEPIWTEKICSRLLETTISLFFWVKREIPYRTQGSEPLNCSLSEHSTRFTSKHITINKTLALPTQHSKISQILDHMFSVDIHKAEIRSTPLCSPCCKVPIRKVVIKGNIEILVKFETFSPSQDIHAFISNLPLCVLAEWVGGPPIYSSICIEVVPEHFQIDCLESNQLFCVLLLRLDIFRQH